MSFILVIIISTGLSLIITHWGITEIYSRLSHHAFLCQSLHASVRRDQAGADTRTEPVPGPAVQSTDCPSLSPDHAVSSSVRHSSIINIHANNIQGIHYGLRRMGIAYGVKCCMVEKSASVLIKVELEVKWEFFQQCVNKMRTLHFLYKRTSHTCNM